MKIVIATKNPGKLREFNRILKPMGFMVLSSDEAGFTGEIEETGETFLENARIKARQTMKATGLICIADDSGLCVDALGGRPGIYSARYSDPGATDEKNNEKLLRELQDVPDDKRTARYVCAICCAFPDGGEIAVEQSCEGTIARGYHGSAGFGYDPLFVVAGRTFGEYGDEEKDAISHRGKALRDFVKKLEQYRENRPEGIYDNQ